MPKTFIKNLEKKSGKPTPNKGLEKKKSGKPAIIKGLEKVGREKK